MTSDEEGSLAIGPHQQGATHVFCPRRPSIVCFDTGVACRFCRDPVDDWTGRGPVAAGFERPVGLDLARSVQRQAQTGLRLRGIDLAADPRPLRFARNFLDTFRDVYKLEFPDINTAVGISGPAFPMNASDRLWEKYQLGERSKIIDPMTKKPAVRNIFLDGDDVSIKAMQARGTVFWQCNVALGGVAQQLADAMHLPARRRAGRPDCRPEPRRSTGSRTRDGARPRPGTRLHLHEALTGAVRTGSQA